MTLTVTSSAFAAGETIPRKYTGDGEDVSPPLAFSGLPDGTQSIALICDDPDAPTPQPWVHWVIYNIPGDVASLDEGVPNDEQLDKPRGACQGTNSWGTIGYGGPAPPRGHGVHHYHFRVYALDADLSLNPGLEKAALLKAISGHVLAEGELVGTYSR